MDNADKSLSPWHPIKDPVDLKTLGKFAEELNECASAVARCIIQGINEREPVTGKLNKEWLEDEIADIMAGIRLTVHRFKLNEDKIFERSEKKENRLREWHNMA